MTHDVPDPVVVRFAGEIDSTHREALILRLRAEDPGVRIGFDLGHRGPDEDPGRITLAVISVPAGLVEPEAVARVATQARDWLATVLTGDVRRLHVELESRTTMAAVRVDPDDPDSAMDEIAAALVNGAGDRPLRWNDSSWSAEPSAAGSSSSAPLLVLAVADEWFPARGGVSSFNRSLCFALAAADAQVFCVVPSSTDDERRDSAKGGVQLVTAERSPGGSEHDALMRKPRLPGDAVPDMIIGHGRITGRAAQSLEDDYPQALRVHIVHMSPDQIDWHKLDREDDAAEKTEDRTRAERELGQNAAIAAAVGPTLHEWFQRELWAVDDSKQVVQLDPGFDEPTQPRPAALPPGKPQILLMGRTEDIAIKGLDISARAIGAAMDLGSQQVDLLIRGVPVDQADELRGKIRGWLGHPLVNVTMRRYTTEFGELSIDLRRASLLLMPSRSEGFGLVGLEAIMAGTPALISDQSGLGVLLSSGVLPDKLADQVVVPVTDDLATDVPQWGHRIAAVLRNRPAAFDTAARIRELMAEERTWRMAACGLLDAARPGCPDELLSS